MHECFKSMCFFSSSTSRVVCHRMIDWKKALNRPWIIEWKALKSMWFMSVLLDWFTRSVESWTHIVKKLLTPHNGPWKLSWSSLKSPIWKSLNFVFKHAVQEAATICPRPCKLNDFWPWKWSKVTWSGQESRVSWPTSVPVFVFLSLFILDLGPMYVRDRRQTHSIA